MWNFAKHLHFFDKHEQLWLAENLTRRHGILNSRGMEDMKTNGQIINMICRNKESKN